MVLRQCRLLQCASPLYFEGKGPGAESEEKREPVSDIDTEVVDNLKVLDPRRPIREAIGLMRHSETSLCATSRHSALQ